MALIFTSLSLIGSVYSSDCNYWNGGLFMYAVPVDECIYMREEVDSSGDYIKNSVKVSCKNINGVDYIEHKIYEESIDCTQSDNNLITTNTTQCSSANECNCNALSNECDIAIVTNYGEDENGLCDYNQYGIAKIIVNKCIPMNNNQQSYIVTCDEINGLIKHTYSGFHCIGDIIANDFVLYIHNGNCFEYQCPPSLAPSKPGIRLELMETLIVWMTCVCISFMWLLG